jgi:uncharacterized protein YjiS (DUF1127 family)
MSEVLARPRFAPTASHGPEQATESKMSATFSAVARPVVAKRPVTVARICLACWDAVSGYVVRRSAITTLRELDDRALRDIGIVRSQIEPAVHGHVTLPERARMS